MKLWRGESATLGFMPEGGFEDAARAGGLVAAEDGASGIVGYVMFRRTAQRVAVIAHLCVDASRRGAGVARRLFDAVKAACADCFEIRLRCRRDFAASALWPRLGFVAVMDEAGRSRDGAVLTSWRYELAPLPLFQRVHGTAADAVRVAIDANVFFDLDESAPGEEESRCLTADWLTEFVDLAVTQELLNEINRREHDQDRERQRQRAFRFALLARDVTREEAVLPRVKALLSTSQSDSSQSDARQVAMTVAAGVGFFVTRDHVVLSAADSLDEAFSLQVMTPHELILRFDELRREEDYRPRRLCFGAGARSMLARADETEELADLVHHGQPAHEPRRRTVGRIRQMLAAPDRYVATCIRHEGALVAAYILDRGDPARLRVPFLAVSPSDLGRTAARHYGESLIVIASRERRSVVEIEEAGPRVGEALAELGFFREGAAWIKITLPVALSAEDVAAEVDRVAASGLLASQVAQRFAAELRMLARGPGIARTQAVDVERALWPAKIVSTELPSFVVPIQPRWAKELFDQELAEGTLFGANPRLVLNSENVYYRAARPEVVTAPGRVLWYVSDDPAYPQSKAIRACSYIDEVIIGPPKELFRRFKRLGVYEWRDVYSVAKNDITKELMAFRFSKTELFARPVPWTSMQEIFRTHTGKGSQLQSPVAISEACFFDIYRRATRADAA